MANPSLVGKIEVVLIIALVVSAALAFTAWREYACGALLLYAAVKIVLPGCDVQKSGYRDPQDERKRSRGFTVRRCTLTISGTFCDYPFSERNGKIDRYLT